MRMDTTLWEESLSHGLKVERNLNFSTISNEEDEYGYSRKKAARDPMSHRIIEKRRRDRMNNCLADLSRLVPTNYLKKGRGRIEKTEIIEMAIKHLKHLQAHPCKDMSTCEVAKVTEQDHKRQYSLGFHECLSETVRFLVEIEGLYAGDGLCVRLVSHLQKHYDKVAGGVSYTQALSMMQSEDSKISPMDIESNHGHPPQLDGFPDAKTPGPLDAPQAGLAAETASNGSRPSEVFSSSDALKHEQDVNSNHAVGSVQEHADYASPPTSGPATATVKVASQLREMLQNPGLPKESLRHGNGSSIPAAQLSSYHSPVNGASSNTTPLQQQHHTSHSQPSQHQQVQQQQQPAKTEEVYKFKNNIKHRFNADLRQHTASPTDSHHSDRVSLPDEERTASDHRHSSAHAVGPEDNRLVVPSVLHNGHSNGHHRPFSDFHPPPHSELSVKIPDRGADEPGHPHWECHAETGSSCGSNPSTPPVARSNGSSSGYSTGGEMPPASKFKTPGPHSPATSPYSRTPDHVVNRSPSPAPPPPPPVPQHQVTGVPIFALHPKGTFYIPLTIDASFIAPYILGTDELAPVLHPVSICVNFNLCHSFKVEKLNGSACHYRTQSYFVDRFSDRYVYGDRPRL